MAESDMQIDHSILKHEVIKCAQKLENAFRKSHKNMLTLVNGQITKQLIFKIKSQNVNLNRAVNKPGVTVVCLSLSAKETIQQGFSIPSNTVWINSSLIERWDVAEDGKLLLLSTESRLRNSNK